MKQRSRALRFGAVAPRSLLLALPIAVAVSGCTTNGLIDYAMAGAAHPPSHRGTKVGDREVLAGDLHCHVLPPDASFHVSRELPETVALAEREGLDFVVLTPHVHARFYADAELRAWTQAALAELRERARATRTDVSILPGFEYTDYAWGHVGASFADLDAVLADVPLAEAVARPELFFEQWLAHGGHLTINHPLLRPLAVAPVGELRADLSWRGFRPDAPPEIAWITRHAQAIETENLEVAQLRDRLFLGDEDRSLRAASRLLDETVHAQQRPIAAVGGSDSHGHWLRPDTFVLAKERTPQAIASALREGRTCVKAPGACTLEARVPGGPWRGVGDALAGDVIELRARGASVTLLVGGAAPRAGGSAPVRVEVPRDRCTLVRAVVDESWSSPIYVNCGFAR
jgi:hypothetical protein